MPMWWREPDDQLQLLLIRWVWASRCARVHDHCNTRDTARAPQKVHLKQKIAKYGGKTAISRG